MPDKHEVGGSSPLGPTKHPKGAGTSKRVHKLLLCGRMLGPTTNVH